jgi:ubiquinone/menaquinone biosynthesis C-methylase UbiE
MGFMVGRAEHHHILRVNPDASRYVGQQKYPVKRSLSLTLNTRMRRGREDSHAAADDLLASPRAGLRGMHTRRSVLLSAAAGALWFGLRAPRAADVPRSEPAHPGTTPHDATVRHSFADVPHWVAVFDDPARAAWQKPTEVVQALGIRPGMCVADLGAGTGYFSRYLSAAVGNGGTVFAVDTEPTLVAHLRERAERERAANVVPILASADNPRLPAGMVDRVLIVDTFHHIDDRVNYLRRLRRVLKPGGRIAIVDFKKDADVPVGPPAEHRLARDHVVEELQSAGYQLIDAPQMLPYQYFLIFQPT